MRTPLIAVLCVGQSLAAQQIPTIRLAAPDAVHEHEFTSVTSLRELQDGRVLVTDGREQRLLLLDFRDGSSREVGRKGRGPREYSMVAMVHPLAADSTIMSDFMSRRWLLLHADSIVATVPPDDRAVEATQALFTGVDAIGRVVRRVDPPLRDGVTMRSGRDTAALVRFRRSDGRADTLGWLRAAPRRLTQQTNAEGRVTASSSRITQLMPTEESFVVYPDGAIAVARLDPFRVDWLLPSGRWLRGDSLPIAKIPVDARERRAYQARNAGSGQAVPPGTPELPTTYPDFVPPFPLGQGVVIAGPRGLLLLRRSKSADFPSMTYLVIDRASRLVGSFTLSDRERVEGASDRYLYVSERDEDDIVRLRRHPWR